MQDLALDLYDEPSRERIEALQWKLAKDLLSSGLKVIIEWGTWSRSERDRLRLGARDVGASVELHYMGETVDVLFERIQRRAMETPPIDRADLLKWAETFEPPTPQEMALFDAVTAVLR
jgi:predicted kinase